MKTQLLTYCFLLFCGIALAGLPSNEKQALLEFYEATNGAHWNKTWDMEADPSDWDGLTIENNRVTGISLLFNNLEGELPESIAQLTQLRILELSFNKLSGSLPESLGSLRNLETLAFNGNNLSGTIPASLGQLAQLKNLHLSSNHFTGVLPVELGNLTNIEVFNVFDNELTGSLPEEIAANLGLRELIVAENDFENTDNVSMILLSNSGTGIDLMAPSFVPAAKTVIATESSDDEN
jgi:hypothetical protein